MTRLNRVVVGIDEVPTNELSLAWAVEEARSRNAGLHLVCAQHWLLSPRPAPVYPEHADPSATEAQRRAAALGDREVAAVRSLAPDLEVDFEAVRGDAIDTLIEQSTQAQVLVLGSRGLGGVGSAVAGSVSSAVAARAHCPVVVMRGPAGHAAERAAVIVGVDATADSHAVLEFAFDHADRHSLRLQAVYCRAASLRESAEWMTHTPSPARNEVLLSEALAGYREKYPSVEVHSAILDSDRVDALVAASHAQALLVVGSHGHGALTGSLLGSVSQGVLHHATCPVAVVPVRNA